MYLQHKDDILSDVLRQAESQVGQVLSRMPVNEKGDTGEYCQCVKDVHCPLVCIDVSRGTFGELDQTVDRADLFIR